jgi:drug/metabolite transporter (DMT)-like permease
MFIAMTGVFVDWSGVSPSTSTAFRCLLALPFLIILAFFEMRAHGSLPRRTVGFHFVAGAALGVDFALWTQSMHLIGTGMATVITNVQVVLVPAMSWLLFRSRIPRRFLVATPFLVAGVGLASGAFRDHVSSRTSLLGAGLALLSGLGFAAYILIAGRIGPAGRPATKLVVVSTAAGLAGALVGLPFGGFAWMPGWHALGWLLALAVCSQVCGWMLVGSGLSRLPSFVSASLLLLQPALFIATGMIVLGERPTTSQLVGCATIIAAVWMVSAYRGGRNID